MKKTMIILAISIGTIFLLLLALPFVFKGKIINLAKSEINKSLNATVDFQGADVSILRSFPNFVLKFNQLEIRGKAPFDQISLFSTKQLLLTLDLMSVFKGSPYQIKKIKLKNPNLHLITLATGEVNYDIMKDDGNENTTVEMDDAPFVLKLEAVEINNGAVIYDDRELVFKMEIAQLDGSLSGNLSMEQTEILTKFNAASVEMSYENYTLLKGVSALFHAKVNADMEKSIYKVQSNQLRFNEMDVQFDGTFRLGDEDMDIDFVAGVPQGSFKQLLSIIPGVYSKDFERLKTDGSFMLNIFMKGIYGNTSFPAFGADLKVENASVSHSDMPQKINNISVSALVANASGNFDDTFIDVNDFRFQMASNSFSAQMKVRKPVSDPEVDAKLNGTVDLGTLAKFVPAETIGQLDGLLNMNLNIKASLSDAENKRFDKIIAKGNLNANNIAFKNAQSEHLILMREGKLMFAPEFIQMNFNDLQIGKSDFNGSGKLGNYLAYFMSNGTMIGNAQLKSEMVDVNDLMNIFGSDSTASPTAETNPTLPELPERIDFTMTGNIAKLLYSNYELKDVNAGIVFKNKQIVFDPISANLLGGNMMMRGSLDGADQKSPLVNINFNIRGFDIPTTYKSVGLFKAAVPIAENTTGNFSTSFQLKGRFDALLNPVYESLQGGGGLQTTQIKIESVGAMNNLASALGNDNFKRLTTDGINLSFEFLNGRVYQKPFNIKYADSDVTMAGSIGFDQQLDYDLVFQLPFEKLGTTVASGISRLAEQSSAKGLKLNPGTNVQIKAKISGPVTAPKITLDYKDYASNIKTAVTQAALAEFDKQKTQLINKGKVEAEKLLQEAKEQGDKLIAQAETAAQAVRNEANTRINQLRIESEKQTAKLVAEGKARGIIAEKLAVEAAKKVTQQTEKTIQGIELEADRQANKLINDAKSKAADLLLIAKQKSELE